MPHSKSLPEVASDTSRKLIEAQQHTLRLLNGLMGEDSQWQTTRSPKDFVDVFGRVLSKGVLHYRQGGTGGNECLRLDPQSMEGVLAVVLSSYHTLNLAKHLVEQRSAAIRAVLEAASAFRMA